MVSVSPTEVLFNLVKNQPTGNPILLETFQIHKVLSDFIRTHQKVFRDLEEVKAALSEWPKFAKEKGVKGKIPFLILYGPKNNKMKIGLISRFGPPLELGTLDSSTN
jgi:hypothetical protein